MPNKNFPKTDRYSTEMGVRDESTERTQSYLRYGEDISNIEDMFSALWIMNISRFMDINTDAIATVEDGCFKPFWQYISHVRMTRDWLDFAVEHMSKWWRIINIFEHNQTLEAFISTLDRFGQRVCKNHFIGPEA